MGVNTSALRYWEQRGLIRPARDGAAARMYRREDLRRLAFISLAQRLGISLDDVAVILHGRPQQWRTALQERVAALEERIRQAQAARDYLTQALECPSEHPVDQCPHLGGMLDRILDGTHAGDDLTVAPPRRPRTRTRTTRQVIMPPA